MTPRKPPKKEALRFSEDDLTIGDLEDFEDVVGKSFSDVFANPDSLDSKSLKAIVWITKRRDNPDFTIDDARNVKLTELELEPAKADPTEPAA